MKLVRETIAGFGPEVVDLKVSVSDRTAWLEHWSTTPPQQVVDSLNEKHLGASIAERGEVGDNRASLSKQEVLRAGITAAQVILFTMGMTLKFGSEYSAGANIVFVLCVALSYPLFYKAYLAVRRMRANVEFLMGAAMAGSLVQGQVMEAATVGVLVTVMDAVTWAAMLSVDRRLRNSITVPPSTIALKGGNTIPAEELKKGMVFVVRAGDGIPADGTVFKGKGLVNESRITGEAMPIPKEKGSEVKSGSVLQSGFLEVTAVADVDGSFQAKVLESVQQAKNTESNTQALVGKFAVWYTPAVILAAAALAIVERDLTRGLVILVAGCPCALLGAAPFVQSATVAILAKRHRFLVKEAMALESLARMKWFGMDKTGTLTTGEFQLIKMASVSDFTQQQLHQWAAALETKDSHPLARSLVQSYTGCLVAFAGWDGLPEVAQFKREGRCGVRGTIEGHNIGVGNTDFLLASAITLEGKAAKIHEEWMNEGTVLFITVDDSVGGLFLLDDALRGDAKGTIKRLTELGITSVLLTGDKQLAANRIASALGMSEIHAGCLPEDKANVLVRASWPQADVGHAGVEQGLLSGTQRGRGPVEVGFIGDGLNDCPALAQAHVGIVMQEIGSQATVDAATAVLQGSLGDLAAVVVVARRSQRLVMANIFLALAINVAVIVAAAFFKMPLWLSVLADNGSLLAVLANSLWPLCWQVEPVPDVSKTEGMESGGKTAFRARGHSAHELYTPNRRKAAL